MLYCLKEGLDSGRLNEMSRWRRTRSYPRMKDLLEKEKGQILDLVNHGLAIVDDELDSKADPLDRLMYFQTILKQGYSGTSVSASTPAEQAVVELGHILNELSQGYNRNLAKHTCEEVLNFLEIEKRNVQRRWRILDKATLDNITADMGCSIASQFLYILDYPRVLYEFAPLARTYGFAVKLADNLSDFREDIKNGFINIPKEEIHHVNGISAADSKVMQINPEKLALSTQYLQNEYKRIEQTFTSADNLMLLARARRPMWKSKTDKKLYIFKEFCHSWLDQAREFVRIETKQ